MLTYRRIARATAAGVVLALAAGAAAAQTLSPLDFLPGDAAVELAPETQEWPEIAAGGPGYLVVWHDKRPVLESIGFEPTGVAFAGNGFDIYAALLDSQGQVLKSPIVVANQGWNQTRPSVAWNGENFLVVWTSERPDWYFFEDIMAARVSPTGELLDPQPLVLRAENASPSNDHASNPRVSSDGTNWVVVWQDLMWQGSTPYPNIAAIRVAPDGSILDPTPVVIQQHASVVFGPTQPDLAFAGDEFLVVWDAFGEAEGKRIGLDLAPLDAQPILIADFSSNPRVASDGTDFLVVVEQYRGYRVSHAGQVLDPAGIGFEVGGTGWQPDGPTVAWDGSTYTIAFGDSATVSTPSELWGARIDAAGSLTGPQQLLVSPETEWTPTVGSTGDGSAQIVFGRRDDLVPEDVRTLRWAADGSIGAPSHVGVGMHRQAYLRLAHNLDEHLAVFVSDGGGVRRILAQRVTAAGVALDPEPTLLTTIPEFEEVEPDVAFNGSEYLVVWVSFDGSVFGQRLAADATLLDPAPVELVHQDSAAGDLGVGALGGDFLISYNHQVSGDLRYLKAFRVRGADLAVLDTPFFIGFNFALDPRVSQLGDRWLVIWENQTRHDQSSSTIAGVFVTATGVATGSFTINQLGLGDDPDVAVIDDRALVVWWNTTNFGDGSLSGRLLLADGTFASDDIQIADANDDQRQPAAAWDGTQFVVAWMDFREVDGIEHERGDIYAARVDFSGNVVDPGGFAVATGPLPEELPEVAGFDGQALIAFSTLHGELEAEVQRLGHRSLGIDGGGIPCADILRVQARCRAFPDGLRIQARVIFSDTSHSGDSVELTVDGLPNQVTITGDRANFTQRDATPGAHTISLTDPGACVADKVVTCQ